MNEPKKSLIKQSDYFTPRWYQEPLIEAFYKGYRRLLMVLPRRSGKDVVSWALLIQEAIRRPGLYWYVWPSYGMGKRGLWNGRLKSGESMLSLLPDEYVIDKHISDMSVHFVNGSIIQIMGAQDVDTLRGTGVHGVVYSEYAKTALESPSAYSVILPSIQGTEGWIIVESTPLGKNDFFDKWILAQNNPKEWFSYLMTIDDTKHIPIEEIKASIDKGEISWELAQQEYWCSFDLGIAQVIYGTALERMRINDQIGQVPWDSAHRVFTAFDIGRDTTSIVFFQSIANKIYVIDYYEKAGQQLDHFVKILESKPYIYQKHFFPHDMRVTEWGGPKFTRLEKARQLGIKGEVVDHVGLEDGIEHVRAAMSRIWIDEVKCKQLIRCLENYRYDKDETKQIYGKKPVHNWASHGADSFRYMCIALSKTADGLTAKEIDRLKSEALYGGQTEQNFFNDPMDQVRY